MEKPRSGKSINIDCPKKENTELQTIPVKNIKGTEKMNAVNKFCGSHNIFHPFSRKDLFISKLVGWICLENFISQMHFTNPELSVAFFKK